MEERIENLEKSVSEMRPALNSLLSVRRSTRTLWIMIMVLVALLGFALGTMAQEPAKPTIMQAVKVKTYIDEKFRVIQVYLTEANQQVKTIIANEAISGKVKNREATKQLLVDLQAVMKANRAKFITATFDTIKVDSLATIEQKSDLLNEITRLKAEIASGEDSTLIQPKINELTNKRNEINKIIKTWKRVRYLSDLNYSGTG